MVTSCIYIADTDTYPTLRVGMQCSHIDLVNLDNSTENTKVLDLVSAVQIWAVSWYCVAAEAFAVLLWLQLLSFGVSQLHSTFDCNLSAA